MRLASILIGKRITWLEDALSDLVSIILICALSCSISWNSFSFMLFLLKVICFSFLNFSFKILSQDSKIIDMINKIFGFKNNYFKSLFSLGCLCALGDFDNLICSDLIVNVFVSFWNPFLSSCSSLNPSFWLSLSSSFWI